MDRANEVRRAGRGPAPYEELSRAAWSRLRGDEALPLGEGDLAALGGLGEPVGLVEIAEAYLPLARLLRLHLAAARALRADTAAFLGRPDRPAPYVVGIAGSVAVGKSTTARVLQALLARGPGRPRVELVPTDGFLLPNAELAARGLLERKGFPESYDLPRLVRFLAEAKAGNAEVSAPVYSHVTYDIVPGAAQVVRRPDVLLLEGLNVLQTGPPGRSGPRVFVSDFFDFSIYVDAAEEDIERWYVERFLALRRTAFREPESFFRRFAALGDDAARQLAAEVWAAINRPNLRENIAPTRARARLLLEKGPSHALRRVRLRRA